MLAKVINVLNNPKYITYFGFSAKKNPPCGGLGMIRSTGLILLKPYLETLN